MANPNDLKYTKTHEWVRKQEHMIEVGITDFAQHQLSDITYVELPEIDLHIDSNEIVAVVESIKAASDMYSPVSGTITEVNTNLNDSPDVINSDPYGEGWVFKMEPDNMNEVDTLMDASAYEESVPDE